MKTYKIVAERKLYFPLPEFGSPLTEDVLVEALAGVAIRGLGQDRLGRPTIDVQLKRPTEAQALNELVGLVEELGFSVIEATVIHWVDEAVDRAILGLLGGGVLGGATENGVVAVAGALTGAIVGWITGVEVQKLKAEFQARRDYDGNWSLQPIDRRPPPAQGYQPEFSPA